MSRPRGFSFTCYNQATLDTFIASHALDYTKLIVGKETCPTTGRLHYQSYVYFANARTVSAVRRMLPGVHIEPSGGDHLHNLNYCSKGDQSKEEFKQLGIEGPNYGLNVDIYAQVGTFERRGSAGGDATAEKWKRARTAAEAGLFCDIDDDIVIKHYGNLKKIRADNIPIPDDIAGTCGTYIYGDPGTGKSHLARDCDSYYMKNITKWWCGYDEEDRVIIDDIDASHAKGDFIQLLKVWTDKYHFRAEVKGGSMTIRPKQVWITSNHAFVETFSALKDVDLQALKRRFKVIHFSNGCRTCEADEHHEVYNNQQ